MSQNHHILALIQIKLNPISQTMDVTYNSTIFLLLIIFTFFLFPSPSKPASNNYNTLVYKTCAANKTFNDQILLSQTLSSLFQQLIAQSSQAKFFKTMEVIKDDNTAIISGLFQCRDDMSAEDCFTCVNSLTHMSNTLCGDATSARVQLQGCYVQYETKDLSQTTVSESKTLEISDESSNNNNNLLLHKECGNPIRREYDDVDFRELMDEAFVTLQVGIVNGNGYFRTIYKSVELMAQCEGDYSGACECSECVSNAVHLAKEQCAESLSAQIYLDKCFISYVYHSDSDGFPRRSVPGASNNQNTAKLAAIVVGGAAVLFLGFIFISMLNSRLKKHDYE